MSDRGPINTDRADAAPVYPPPRIAITERDAATASFHTFRIEEGEGGVSYHVVVPHPRVQAQLDRIEQKLNQLLGEVDL